ncbi:MAG: rRNA pseudouridine synthase [Eubacterium sp.]|nr:rRNA pseudouridine synthase [Eubacterium sp.]
MRLDKYLADMGLGTRSELKKDIRAGAAMINQQVVRDPGTAVSDADEVVFRGAPVMYESSVYYMLHKPAGVITATRDSREKTVLNLLPDQARKDLFPVGRLDRDTEGLLLITNDGALAHRLLSPRHHVDKIYLAVVSGEPVSENEIAAFLQGITLEDGTKCLPAELDSLNSELAERYMPTDSYESSKGSAVSEKGSPVTEKAGAAFDLAVPGIAMLHAEEHRQSLASVQVTIREGKYHQIKRMFHAIGREVLYLKRISMGSLVLDPDLPAGACRRLTSSEVAALKSVGMSASPDR